MEIRDDAKFCIFAPLSDKLDAYECKRIYNEIKKENRTIALDLSQVSDCTSDFIETLREISKIKKIGIFNIPSDIFVLFNTMKIDKIANLFVSQADFIENSRQLINRDFAVL